MRKSKIIKLDDLELTVKELKVRQIWQLFQQDGAAAVDMLARLEQLLEWCCPELSRDAAMDLAPSELKTIYSAFEEVNADFLELARKMGLDAVLESLRAEIANSLQTLTGPSASSSEPDTAT